jgi:hypothetical protein
MKEKEQEIKQLIDNCKIDGLKDLAIIMHQKEIKGFDMVRIFKKQTKETLEQQYPIWQNQLDEFYKQFESSKMLCDLLTEENQNEVIEGMFSYKECAFMHYKLELSIEFHKDCIKLMKKVIENK